jgi:hypothetical protein
LWGHQAPEALLLLIQKNIKVPVVRVRLRRGLFPGKSIALLLPAVLLQGLSCMDSFAVLPLCGILSLLLFHGQEAIPLAVLRDRGLGIFHRPLQSLIMRLHQ